MERHDPIKICIIDDIPAVVRGLSQRIAWEDHGMTVAATASNGEEGLECLRRVRPDIVLTDIRMPLMDGLEMMRTILPEQPEMKVIFFTAYTDFSYAQEAVKLGAFDFIVKPFTPAHVLEVALKAKASIERERSKAAYMQGMERKLRESLPYLRQEFMRLLIRYGTRQQSQSRQWDFYGITMEKNDFWVMVAEMDHFPERTADLPVGEVELIRFAVQNILEETVSSHTSGIVFRENINQFVIVANPAAAMDAGQLAEKCREHVCKHTYQTVSIGVGHEVKDTSQLAASYAQALAALANTFLSGGNSVYLYKDGEFRGADEPQYSYEQEKELLFCLRSANLDKAEEQLQGIWDGWISAGKHPHPSVLKTLCLELAHAIHRTFAEKSTVEEIQELEGKLADMNKAATFEELCGLIREFCRQGCGYLRKRQVSESRVLVERGIAHIQRHLHENLSVADCAKAVHLSPSYFSNLFKKEMGVTLAQYITHCRMEKAKELVLEGMQVQDIAGSLGYEDRPYFTELFKKHTGMTPTEFRTKYAECAEARKSGFLSPE